VNEKLLTHAFSIQIAEADDISEAPHPREMTELEATFEKMEQELLEVKANLT
jgi:hypothetical protein